MDGNKIVNSVRVGGWVYLEGSGHSLFEGGTKENRNVLVTLLKFKLGTF
jgi:hypothetical protein